MPLTAYVASLYTRGLSVHTVNGHIRVIKAFYNYLDVRRHIRNNAARCLKKKKADDRVPRAISGKVRKELIDTAFNRKGIYAKRGRRLVVFSAEAKAAIKEYLEQRGDILTRLIALGLVKPGEPKGCHVWLGHKGPLTYWGVRMMLKSIVKETRENVDRETVDKIDNSPTNASTDSGGCSGLTNRGGWL